MACWGGYITYSFFIPNEHGILAQNFWPFHKWTRENVKDPLDRNVYLHWSSLTANWSHRVIMDEKSSETNYKHKSIILYCQEAQNNPAGFPRVHCPYDHFTKWQNTKQQILKLTSRHVQFLNVKILNFYYNLKSSM